jgi:hypothetical protein
LTIVVERSSAPGNATAVRSLSFNINYKAKNIVKTAISERTRCEDRFVNEESGLDGKVRRRAGIARKRIEYAR